jgi:beta-glucosidase
VSNPTETDARGALCVAALGLVAALVACRTQPPVVLIDELADDCQTETADEVRPWLDASYTPSCRAELVLATLPTLEAKLAFLEGGGFGPPPALAEIGLVVGGTQDGPAGFNGGTAWPTPMTVAASFDEELALRFGQAMGREFHESGRNGILGPAFDLTRTWRFGRSTESFGEDPYLSARMAAREVAGIQAEHVLVTMKHYAVYTQEQGRLGDNPIGERPAVDQIVSERALRELYLPPFEAAVVEGGAGGVMCSFPRINGTYACEHDVLLTGILKSEWGFDGAVAPDFPVAQRSIARAFNAGLDAGTMSPVVPGGTSASIGRFAGELSLRDAVEQGLVSESRVDDMIRRRLVPGFRIGTFDNPAVAVRDEPSTPETRVLAAEIVAAGAVLLKNDGVLPLTEETRRIAVIGTQAGEGAVVVEQGSPNVPPRHLVTALDGLRARAPEGVTIAHAPGGHGLGALPAPPPGLFTNVAGRAGFDAEYYPSPDIALRDDAFAARAEPAVNLSGLPEVAGLPPAKTWAARWTAVFSAQDSGVHRFTLEGSGTAQLWIEAELAGAFDNADFGATIHADIALEAGEEAAFDIRYSPRVTLGDAERSQFGAVLGPALRLGYAPPDALEAEAAAAAAGADVAVVFAGHVVGEGWDRTTLDLPARQNEQIAAVAAANPNTVVVLTVGGPVAMPWLDDVAGVLVLWLPGDAYGTAAARLLYGDDDPGGRLPVTFPADETQGPGTTQATYPGTLTADGALDRVVFEEDLAIGYRYWDAHGQTPLFPFGHGLSYARFAVEGLGARATADGGAELRARVSNVSDRPGTETLQVYLGFPASAGAPPRQLKAMAKVALAPGESREVAIPLDARAFQVWDPDADRWIVPRGRFTVMLGRSSRDIVEETTLSPRRR